MVNYVPVNSKTGHAPPRRLVLQKASNPTNDYSKIVLFIKPFIQSKYPTEKKKQIILSLGKRFVHMFNKIVHSRKPTFNGLIPKALKCSNKTVNIGAMTHEHPPARHLSGIRHFIGPGGGEFVRKPLQQTSVGAFVNSSRSG